MSARTAHITHTETLTECTDCAGACAECIPRTLLPLSLSYSLSRSLFLRFSVRQQKKKKVEGFYPWTKIVTHIECFSNQNYDYWIANHTTIHQNVICWGTPNHKLDSIFLLFTVKMGDPELLLSRREQSKRWRYRLCYSIHNKTFVHVLHH